MSESTANTSATRRLRSRPRRRAVRLLLVLALAGGLAWLRWHGMPSVAWQALNDADRYELLSLRPYPWKPGFYRHEVLGSTLITDAKTRDRLNRALQRGARESDGTEMSCFNPRHGIRVTHAGVTTDFVICFECRQVEVWRGDKKIAFFLTSESPQPAFDDVLRNAGVPLADRAN